MDLGLTIGATQVALGAEEAPVGTQDIFVVIGQSNAVGYAEDDGGAAYPAGVQHWTSAGAWEPIGFRLDHGPWEDVATATQFGFAKSFSGAFIAANPLSDLYLVGAADGGTGFAPGDWNPGDTLYNNAVARVNAAIAAAPVGAQLRGILWHQGESDRDSPTYAADLLQFIQAFRTDVAAAHSTTPFVVGGHTADGEWWDETIQLASQALPSTLAYCGYADISAPQEPGLSDGVHFDAAATRAFGEAYYAGFMNAATNTTTTPSGTITTGAPVYADVTLNGTWQAAGISLGAESADRQLLIALANRHDSTLPRPVSVMLGDTPAMRIVTRGTGRVSGTNVALYSARIPEGATSDLSVTFDFVPQQVGVVVVPVYGAQDPVASIDGFSYATGVAGHGASISTSVQAQAGDLIFAASGAIAPGGASGTMSLGNSSDNLISGTNRSVHTGHMVATTSGTQTVTCDFGATTVNYPTIAAVVLRPT